MPPSLFLQYNWRTSDPVGKITVLDQYGNVVVEAYSNGAEAKAVDPGTYRIVVEELVEPWKFIQARVWWEIPYEKTLYYSVKEFTITVSDDEKVSIDVLFKPMRVVGVYVDVKKQEGYPLTIELKAGGRTLGSVVADQPGLYPIMIREMEVNKKYQIALKITDSSGNVEWKLGWLEFTMDTGKFVVRRITLAETEPLHVICQFCADEPMQAVSIDWGDPEPGRPPHWLDSWARGNPTTSCSWRLLREHTYSKPGEYTVSVYWLKGTGLGLGYRMKIQVGGG
ncbi:MAG: hypothetical protein DRJ31_08455 [Candidatus Methanomethylicota archaeon]|uniref:PKD domain-containing protein n=1 Tax=Thermoproteota archaeon TaxID=2056631 RepID=A0A497EN00_9CREN|nr:MAG: hypothetical protein DRJ31_08455 [Candidatus Verstraetearchaeota archaeon]